ncbi:MAG TPA: hypothetical protein VME69_04135 [Methylocella sp.]|nr:hypothetical protein [Methylocella sp.]
MDNQDLAPAEPQDRSQLLGFLRRKLPYVAVLAAAIFGVAYTNISHQPLNGFWEVLTVAIGFVCVATAWPFAPDRQARIRLVWSQALHWVTILVTMNLVLLPGFQRLLPVPATSLILLMLLALGTFLAGINLLSLQICFLGLAMALSVPAITWLKQSALFLLLSAVALLGLVVAFWPRGNKSYNV